MITKPDKAEFIIIQKTPHSWDIVSHSGHTVQKGIILHSIGEALEYIRRYVSSYSGMGYDIKPLKQVDFKSKK